MPIILLGRIPLPRLTTYVAVSVFLFACSCCYSRMDVREVIRPVISEPEVHESHAEHFYQDLMAKDDVVPIQSSARNSSNEDGVFDDIKAVKYLGIINMAVCCLILLVRGIQKIVFGELRVIEHQHLRDKFWNFAFYKFIFIFGVMNVQSTEKIVLWCAWFGVLVCLHLLAQLCKDRFEYLSFSPATPMKTHIKVLLLLFGIQATSVALLVACVLVGYFLESVNIFFFMVAEVILLMVKTSYVIMRYAIHLWDLRQDQLWENRSFYAYYTELVFELVALSIEFCNHLHMLIWSKFLLNMASLVICMQLRYLFYELQRRYRRHKNRLRVINTMDEKFRMATQEEIEQLTDDCAICWERMESARRLPCGHFFHNACLRSWLEQDASCPICRRSLIDVRSPDQPHPRAPGAADETGPAPNINLHAHPPVINSNFMTNHFFHFDGSRYVSWLPSFSVEVSHTQIMGNRQMATTVQTSQLDNLARQVQDVFPSMPLDTILNDLQLTHSMEHTIENIVEGRLQYPPIFPRTSVNGSDSDGASSSESDDSSSSSTSSLFSHLPHYDAEPPTVTPSDSTVEPSSDFYDPLPSTSSHSIDLGVREVPQEAYPSNHTAEHVHLANCGRRFSKSSQERESMLSQRKQLLITQAKRRFLAKEANSQDLPQMMSTSSPMSASCHSAETLASDSLQTHQDASPSSDIRQRRERAFLAAVRRLQQD
ncbi:hypothetical protein LSH36_418g02105 [Paralvinella palmiformis]|uniref:E3 ubiquitin-protein ligase AMFR n=1 Tax=Paralvinella palmiformis TaxID=53620 RepID=A0AAD9N0Y5_9ANNE|nr:hypothetical protein LSH36_418g02105 [Paralvinella palmiformis]